MPTLPRPVHQAPPVEPAGRPASTSGSGTLGAASRRRLAIDALGITVSAFAFGVVYGLSARQHGFSIVEALTMSVFVLAGASQFAAVGLLAQGLPWLAIVGLTALLNARHLLYSAALAPWFAGRSLLHRAAAAHVLTDETFALALPHFQRLGRFDAGGYWLAAGLVVSPWISATLLGFAGGEFLPDTHGLGLDVVFPAAMAGLATALITGRRELVAAAAGVAIGLPVALLTQPSLGIVAGGVCGPLVAMLVPGPGNESDVDATDLAKGPA
jgi:4-azaleucine resistance transporter AzlC